jgi:hypothetical protein
VVAGHRGIADSEDQQDHTHHDVREGNPRAIAQQHRDRRTAGHGRQWRSRRDHEEGDSEYS